MYSGDVDQTEDGKEKVWVYNFTKGKTDFLRKVGKYKLEDIQDLVAR